MFVKVYEYHIKEDQEALFLDLQETVAGIYKSYLNCEVMFLKSIRDQSLWLEIATYKSEEEYMSGIQKVNHELIGQGVFAQFKTCLASDVTAIKESDFIMKLKV